MQKGRCMKTPKRTQRYIEAPTRYDDGVVAYTAVEYNRWKRKNRVARLKDKIARLTAENKWLSEERRKYIEYYFNALRDLVSMQEEFTKKKRSRKENLQ